MTSRGQSADDAAARDWSAASAVRPADCLHQPREPVDVARARAVAPNSRCAPRSARASIGSSARCSPTACCWPPRRRARHCYRAVVAAAAGRAAGATSLPIAEVPPLDLRMLAVHARRLTTVTGLAFGCCRRPRVCRKADGSALKEGARGGTSRGTERLRSALVVPKSWRRSC